jgi:trans-aconitate 2-methyltransferase
MNKDAWNPQQYKKFSKERDQPFYDLVKLIVPEPNMNVVDLGCGTGHLTKVLHNTLKAKHTLGIDSSEAMLLESKTFQVTNLSFEKCSIEGFSPQEKYDLIFSNAALQWLPDHPKLFKQITQYLASQGQLAIQMPSNFDYPTHLIAFELASEAPFSDVLKDSFKRSVLKIDEYAELLYQLGFKEQNARLQVYGHTLESTESIIEWVRGSLLTYYRSLLPPPLFDQFETEYRSRILSRFGKKSPFFMPFKRLLIWGRKDD